MDKIQQAMIDSHDRCVEMTLRDDDGNFAGKSPNVTDDEFHREHLRHSVLYALRWDCEATAAMLRECLALVAEKGK